MIVKNYKRDDSLKKFRGKRRYFRNLHKAVATEHLRLDFGKGSWFDLWHTHLDFMGHGNRSIKIRREHVKAHIALYKSLLKNLEIFEKPFQTWIGKDGQDAGSDAVYIHSLNPNEDNFPLKIKNIDWEIELPLYLKGLIDKQEFDIGRNLSETEVHFIIQAKCLKNRL